MSITAREVCLWRVGGVWKFDGSCRCKLERWHSEPHQCVCGSQEGCVQREAERGAL